MTPLEIVSLLSRAVWVLLGLLTAADYASHRDSVRRDNFLLFASVGLGILLPGLGLVAGVEDQWVAAAGGIPVLAEPYCWLRVVQHFRPVSPWMLRPTLVGMIASWIAIASLPSPLPVPATVFTVLYMAIPNLSGAALLVRGAATHRGALRRRLQLGAAGSGLLGLILLLALVQVAAPAAKDMIAPLSSLLTVGCVAAFYLAFAPPNWIRDTWSSLQLSGQVVPILLVTAGLTGLFATLVVGSSLRSAAFDEVNRSQITLAQSSADTIGQHLASALGSVRQAATDSSIRQAFDQEPQDLAVVTENLTDLLERTSFARATFAVDANGILLTYLPRDPSTFDQSLIGGDFSRRDYFQGAVRTRSPFVAGTFVSSAGATFAIAAPVFGRDSEIRAVVGASFDPAPIGEFVQPKGATADTRLVVTTSGLIAIHPQLDRLSLPIDQESPWAASWTGGPSSVVEVSPLGRDERLVAYAPVASNGWGVLISTPTASIFAPVETATRQAISWVLVCTMLLSALGAFFTSRLFRPLHALALATSQLGAGDYSARMAERGAADLRGVAREFNDMAAALGTKDAQLKRKSDELEEQYRRVQEASRLKGEFLANMSHELRTPLNGIIGFAELMHDERVGPVSAEHKEYLGDILISANHLLQLINDVLDLSKVESGKMDFYPEPVAMSRVIGEVRDVLRTLSATKRIQVDVEIDPEVESVVADPARLKQILYNYLSNAIKFTPNEGEVRVRVDADGPDRYRLAVSDTGIGIPADQMHRLFVEFQQLDASVAKKYQGTGLGLALTKRLAEAQGGSVGVESSPRVGSTFYAVLPRVMRALEDVEQPIPAMPASDGPGPSVLIVDDNPSDRQWLAHVLGDAGYHVTVAESGADALRLCHQQIFDGITLDLLLPDLPGSKVLQEIRTETANAETPIVVVTVLAQADIGRGFAIQDYLIKPVREADLLDALARAGVEASENRKILVVDDDAAVRDLLTATLGAGFQPICVADGIRGLEVVQSEEIGAVVLDLLMPEMDGFEFLDRLRHLPAGRRTPVVVLTAKDLTPQDRRRLQSSTLAVVSKSNGGTTALLAELDAWITRSPAATAEGRSPLQMLAAGAIRSSASRI